MKKLAVIALAGGMAFAAAPAYKAATNLGWYAGVGINNYAGMTEENMIPAQESTKYKLDKEVIGWGLFAGYRNTQHFGTELGFSSLGNITYKNEADSSLKAKQKNMWIVSYDANLYMPLVAGLEVFAKGGVDYFTGKTTFDDTSLSDVKLSTFGLNFGGGLQYMYQQFGARVSYTDYQTMTQSQKDGFNVPNLLGLDVFYTFA